MRVFVTAVDQGDGTLGIEFFESQECISILEDELPEYYRGEGGRSLIFNPDGQVEVYTLDDVYQMIRDMKGHDDE